ncbi:hypothetical protein C5167_030154 [Papaver somniferum]|nr:hypothetical protein C5167_030154 [Papaver somniferum]
MSDCILCAKSMECVSFAEIKEYIVILACTSLKPGMIWRLFLAKRVVNLCPEEQSSRRYVADEVNRHDMEIYLVIVKDTRELFPRHQSSVERILGSASSQSAMAGAGMDYSVFLFV